MENRRIVVPKDEDARKLLDRNEAVDNQLLTMILSENELLSLWNIGFFDAINNIARANIDLSEDDAITDISILEDTISSYAFEMKFPNGELNRIVLEIKKLFSEAVLRKTGVFFYF